MASRATLPTVSRWKMSMSSVEFLKVSSALSIDCVRMYQSKKRLPEISTSNQDSVSTPSLRSDCITSSRRLAKVSRQVATLCSAHIDSRLTANPGSTGRSNRFDDTVVCPTISWNSLCAHTPRLDCGIGDGRRQPCISIAAPCRFAHGLDRVPLLWTPKRKAHRRSSARRSTRHVIENKNHLQYGAAAANVRQAEAAHSMTTPHPNGSCRQLADRGTGRRTVGVRPRLKTDCFTKDLYRESISTEQGSRNADVESNAQKK